MQLTLRKILVAFCLLQVMKPEILIWAQDTTTPREDRSNEKYVTLNSVENFSAVNIEKELLSTTEAPSNNCSGDSIQELCDLNTTESIELQATTIESHNIIDENSSNIPTDVEETTTNAPISSVETPTSTPANEDKTTNSKNLESSNPVAASDFNCTKAEALPHSIDCRRYYNCSQMDDLDSLQATEQLCPTGLAFHIEFSSCMRDLSPCTPEHGGFECSSAGNFPHPNNDTNLYYKCVPYLDGRVGLYHKFIVKCGIGRIFIPQVGKCLVDLNTIGSYSGLSLNLNEPSDEQLIKMELKQWKLKEKTKLKEEKSKLKYEQKLQKELEKQLAKETKEKAKAEKKQQKLIYSEKYDDE